MSAVRIYATADMGPQGWRADAACLGQHEIMDLPEDTRHIDRLHVRLALTLCAQCPVRAACAEHTLHNPPAHHCVQGGLIWTKKEIRAAHAELDERPRVPCGTTQGYHQHIARGEDTCQPCRDAEAAFRRRIRHRTTNDLALF